MDRGMWYCSLSAEQEPTQGCWEQDSEEAFTGVRPDVGHFRMFRCLTFSHVPSKKRTKLEPTADKGIFVGYNETSKAYWIYILAQRKIVVWRDARFEEERVFKKSLDLRDIDSS